jgi:hypothetical protein
VCSGDAPQGRNQRRHDLAATSEEPGARRSLHNIIEASELKQKLENKAMIADTPSPGFVHKSLANGIIVSTCSLCQKTIGSPTPVSLRMAEENHLHLCASCTRKPK